MGTEVIEGAFEGVDGDEDPEEDGLCLEDLSFLSFRSDMEDKVVYNGLLPKQLQ